ncbi:MAG: hypothetical protein K8R79_05795, partial [Calditrichales bacterium]|nr:hypothetical protein [Calditrichales bacterium]
MKLKIKNTRFVKIMSPWSVVLLVLLALIIFLPALLEYHNSKNDLLQIWREQGRLLSDIILRSGNSIMILDEETRQSREDRLMDLGKYVRHLDSLNYPHKKQVIRYIRSQSRSMILFYDKHGAPENQFGYRGGGQFPLPIQKIIKKFIQSDTSKAQIKVLKGFTQNINHGYALIIRRAQERGFIGIIQRRGQRQGMFGLQRLKQWLDRIAENPSIVYAQIQRNDKIIAQSGMLFPDKLPDLIQNKQERTKWRLYEKDNRSIFEYVQYGRNGIISRIGLSTEALDSLQNSLVSRLLINSFLLLVIGGILTVYILKKQNFTLLTGKYRQMQTYTGSILQNAGEGIIVLDENRQITIFNQAAYGLLNVKSIDPIGCKISEISLSLPGQIIDWFVQFKNLSDVPAQITTQTGEKYLLITANRITYSGTENNTQQQIYIILLRDYTVQRELENFRSRQSKLTAMGQLASRVAHEIRNPLNGIGVIAQRLRREFSPQQDEEEYKQMTQSIRHETGRINKIIEAFLTYARTPQLKLERHNLKEIINDLQPLLQSFGSTKLTLSLHDDCYAKIDRDQISQVIINLVKNGAEALQKDGAVKIILNSSEGKIFFIVEDN